MTLNALTCGWNQRRQVMPASTSKVQIWVWIIILFFEDLKKFDFYLVIPMPKISKIRGLSTETRFVTRSSDSFIIFDVKF